MGKLIEFLEGKKTYICAVVIALTYIFRSQNIIDDTTANILLGVFGGGAIASMRNGIKKGE